MTGWQHGGVSADSSCICACVAETPAFVDGDEFARLVYGKLETRHVRMKSAGCADSSYGLASASTRPRAPAFLRNDWWRRRRYSRIDSPSPAFHAACRCRTSACGVPQAAGEIKIQETDGCSSTGTSFRSSGPGGWGTSTTIPSRCSTLCLTGA